MEQVWVYGNSYESTLVAIVVPQKHELMGWAKQNGQGSSFEEVVRTPDVCALCVCKRSCRAAANSPYQAHARQHILLWVQAACGMRSVL